MKVSVVVRRFTLVSGLVAALVAWAPTAKAEVKKIFIDTKVSPAFDGALVRGCGQAYALQTVEPVTYRCGTRRVCQARSSGSERDTRARPHAVAPMNCVPEDSRRRSGRPRRRRCSWPRRVAHLSDEPDVTWLVNGLAAKDGIEPSGP